MQQVCQAVEAAGGGEMVWGSGGCGGGRGISCWMVPRTWEMLSVQQVCQAVGASEGRKVFGGASMVWEGMQVAHQGAGRYDQCCRCVKPGEQGGGNRQEGRDKCFECELYEAATDDEVPLGGDAVVVRQPPPLQRSLHTRTWPWSCTSFALLASK